jgi:hypothetical protein
MQMVDPYNTLEVSFEQGNLEVPNNKRKTWFLTLSKLTNYYYFINEMSIWLEIHCMNGHCSY